MTTIQVPESLASAFARLSTEERARFLHVMEEYLRYPTASELLRASSDEAAKRGLTPEVLEQLMKDVS